jgi:hypothetical protein
VLSSPMRHSRQVQFRTQAMPMMQRSTRRL